MVLLATSYLPVIVSCIFSMSIEFVDLDYCNLRKITIILEQVYFFVSVVIVSMA